jgi:hypothetical protein
MDAKTRRTLEMAKRALNFSQAHPYENPGYVAAVSRLEASVARAGLLAVQQRDGFSEVRAAAAQKRELRRKMRRTHLPHLATVAEAADKERPGLAEKFVLVPAAAPYMAFRAAAQGFATQALVEKDLLLKHGLLEPIVESFNEAIQEFDRAVERGTEGRRAHVGARAELDAIADEVIQIVEYIDTLNRFRFTDDPESLAGWQSNSNIFGPVRSGGPAGGGTAGQPPVGAPPAAGSKDVDHAA